MCVHRDPLMADGVREYLEGMAKLFVGGNPACHDCVSTGRGSPAWMDMSDPRPGGPCARQCSPSGHP